jgi:pimeloyl-ACP methyl ester carboxylesterase
MQYIETTATSSAPTLVLVHGSWQDGRCWSSVQQHLAVSGIHSLAPTLPGHRDGDDRLAVSHSDYVDSVIAALDRLGEPAVLVGHSFGGSIISRVAELRPADCHGLIYYSAFVPRDGERVADSLPAQFVEFLDQAAARVDRAIELPDQALREAFANTADEETLARIRALLVPEPYAPIFDTLALPAFPGLPIPTVYISCHDDRTMPPGTFHPGQSSRLRDPKLIETDGDHMCLLTASERLADTLLEALDLIDADGRVRPTEVENDRDAAQGHPVPGRSSSIPASARRTTLRPTGRQSLEPRDRSLG